jgi:predicted PolB exonuclease-like 3'-5' exonuclease
MAVKFLHYLFSHDNCALDDYSDIMRIGSQLLDYEQIEEAFVKKWNKEKYASDVDAGYFSRLIFILRSTKAIRRDELAEQAGCSVETVKRTIRFLKRFNLIDSTRDGYEKKPKFNKFLRRFVKKQPDFFSEAVRGSGFISNNDNELDAN